MKKAVIDWQKVKYYLQAQCSQIEIAAQLGISRDCLSDRCKKDNKISWEEYAQRHKSQGIANVKLKHYRKIMEEGDNTAMIFWEKNYAGMSDKMNHTITPDSEITIRRIIINKDLQEAADDNNV